MKKIFTFLCIIAVAYTNAQTQDATPEKLSFEKGSMLINGNLSLTLNKNEFSDGNQTGNRDQFGFSINPSFAYAISDNLFLGLGLGYGYAKGDTDTNNQGIVNTDSFTNKSYRIFPYVRYYKGIGKKVAVYLQGEARYTYSDGIQGVLNAYDTQSVFVGVRPGITLMINKNLALETSIGALGYTYAKGERNQNTSESKYNAFDFSLNSSNLLFGLSYYL